MDGYVGIDFDNINKGFWDKIASIIVKQCNKAQSKIPTKIRGCEHEFDSDFCPECGKPKFIKNPKRKTYSKKTILNDFRLPDYLDDWCRGINVHNIDCDNHNYGYMILGIYLSDIENYEDETIRQIKMIFIHRFKNVFDVDLAYDYISLY